MMVWAAVWVIVVALAAVVVWSAISRAGAHVTNQAALRVPNNTVTPTPLPPTPGTTPHATPPATPLPSPAASSFPTPRSTSRSTARPTPRETTTEDPAPVAVQGSWSGEAGRVSATCRAQRISLDAAVPADGFTVEIGNRGPETLEIEFKQNQGDREFSVKGTCRSDGPRFTVEQG
jgi:type IV secretory pathway VirB10-like protein